jgi:hypothetical protein
MPQDALKPDERAVLLVLTALGTEISNPELEKRFGFTIAKGVRERLTRLKLISAEVGLRRAYFHAATSDGWGRVADELPHELPKNPVGAAAATLIGEQLHRYLARADLRLHDIFVPLPDESEVAPATARKPAAVDSGSDVEARIRDAYRELAATPGSPVRLSRLRAHLADLSRDEIDRELRRLNRTHRINLSPESNRKGLTEADETAAIVIGRQPKHLIVMELR